MIWCRYKYRRQLNPDGNFTAQHMKMRQPGHDVALTDGEGFCVKNDPYKSHLEEAEDLRQVFNM